MKLKVGEIYYLQSTLFNKFIKIISIGRIVKFVYGGYYDVKKVNLNNLYNDYYYDLSNMSNDDYGNFICDSNNLYTQNKLNNLFNTYKEEIDNKYEKNIYLWEKDHKLTTFTKTNGNYTIEQINKNKIFDEKNIIIPKKDFEKYNLYLNKFNYLTKEKIKSIKRDQLIDKLCN